MRTALLLLLCLLSAAAARGEFAVKYYIDGHVVASGLQPVPSNGPVEMDGDPSSLEAIVFGNGEFQQMMWANFGVTNLLTGQTQWFPFDPAAQNPGSGQYAVFIPPVFMDVDGDNLLDALVVVYDGYAQELKTAVIGWVGTAAVNSPGNDPTVATLKAIQPNPTSGPASIGFSLPGRSQVHLAIYDVTGRRIVDLIDGTMAGGDYTIPWDGKDDSGLPVVSGNYFYQLTVDGREESRRMVIVR